MAPQITVDQISAAMIRDRHRLRRMWRALDKHPPGAGTDDHRWAKFAQAVRASIDLRRQRQAALPKIRFDQDLPILEHRQRIADTILRHQVVVVSGETGSGKSTQLPKICLDAGLGIEGTIGHTQPRRIAARSIATRIADELQVPLGQQVGFKMRFTDRTNPRTLIKLMTDGILLAETQGDRFLEQYEVLILDEAHERSLNVDFLLGYARRLLPRRPELRLIITSATIDADRFSRHFELSGEPAPIIEVSGRSFPVEVRYRGGDAAAEDGVEGDELERIVSAVHELAAIDRGHILVFLPTERDIRETAKRFRAEKWPGDGARRTEILPLYARLSAAEQNRVFARYDYRRIILATNVAESSLTVPDIRYVVDTGTARISRYAPRSKVQRLPIESISRASADQRRGRCGRIAPGVCIRLFSEADYVARAPYTTPEIQRTNLAAVILRAAALRLGPVEGFPFLDPPRAEAVRDGYRTLFEIGAVDRNQELTDIGRQLSRLPVDPRIARIILAAQDQHCLPEILIIGSALELQDPRERPHDKQQAADERHAQFADERSDFMSYLKLWDFFHGLKEKLSRNRLRRACGENFLSYNRLREWMEIHRQLLQLVSQAGIRVHSRTDDCDAVHRTLLSGFLSGVAYRSGEHEYTGAGGVKFQLWPGSGLFQARPKWCLVAELVETTRRYGRTVARINPAWVEPLAAHLVKRTYSDPHWHHTSGSVMAFERVTLFGLPIVARRRVRYGPIDPAAAREIFLRDGLSHEQPVPEGKAQTAQPPPIRDAFYVHNQQVLDAAARLAAKMRRGDFLVDHYKLYRFYNARVPTDVFDLRGLRKWLNSTDHHDPDALKMQLADLLQATEPDSPASQFPDQLAVGALRLPAEYHFEPGSPQDGVTVNVPQDGLGQLEPGRVGWLVPGLLEEKVVALIRSLPKAIRRNVIPAPEVARRVVSDLKFGEGDFLQAVVDRLSAIAGETIPPEAFRLDKLPPHLQLNIRVIDREGGVVAEGRDLAVVRGAAGRQPSAELPSIDEKRWHRDGLTSWDFGDLPDVVPVTRNQVEVPTYPALIDCRTHVNLRLVASPSLAERQLRRGIRRLYALGQSSALRAQVRWLPRWSEIGVFAAGLMQPDELKQQVTDLLADRAFLGDAEELPRNAREFAEPLAAAGEHLAAAAQDVARLLPRLFEGYHRARLSVEQHQVEKWRTTLRDVDAQLQSLTAASFLTETPWKWLVEFPRYFAAICYRLERLSHGSQARDEEATRDIHKFSRRYAETRAGHDQLGLYDAQLELFRWMLEEYRVSVFAQPLGTSVKISPERLDKQWRKVRSPAGSRS